MVQQTYVKTMEDKNITIEQARKGFQKAKNCLKEEYSKKQNTN